MKYTFKTLVFLFECKFMKGVKNTQHIKQSVILLHNKEIALIVLEYL